MESRPGEPGQVPELETHPEAMTILPLREPAKQGHPHDFKVTSRRPPTGGGACRVGTDKGLGWEGARHGTASATD